MQWVGLYLLHLLTATLGVMLATFILLNAVLRPVLEPRIRHADLISLVNGPVYPLPVVLAALAGYIGYAQFKGNYRFWVWIVPFVYLATKIILWAPSSVLVGHGLGAILAHFFVGTPPHYPEGGVTLPFYTSLSYTLGALLDAGRVFHFVRPSEGAGH